jgi:dipeptidyl aminopeptidase/acylaminoacyl peptidase
MKARRNSGAWIALMALAAGPLVAAVFGPRDMLGIAAFAESGQPVVSPNGEWVAYATADPADESNILARHPTSFLWVASAKGGSPRRILGESEHAGEPVWSPDGRALAFLCTRAGRAQVVIWDQASGKVRELGEPFAHDRSSWPSEGLGPYWTPDGGALVLAELEPEAPAPEKRRVTVIRGSDAIVPGDTFFVDRRTWKLAAIDVSSGKQRLLTNKPYSLRSLQLSPGGGHALFRAVTPETLGHFRAEKAETWILSLSGGEPRSAFPGGQPAWAVFSPDGRELLYPDSNKLHAQPLDGGADRVVMDKFPGQTRQPAVSARLKWLAVLAARPGTGPKDKRMYSILQPTDDVLAVDLSSGKSHRLTAENRRDELSAPVWSGDGRTLFYRAVDPDTFRETVYGWKPEDSAPARLFSADEQIAHLSPSADGRRLGFTAMSATRTNDAYLLDTANRERRSVTKLNPQLDSFRFAAPEMFEFHSADGQPLRALLYKPDGAGPDHRVSTVTYVYEKLSPTRNRFNPEAQMHVSAGYAYLAPDVFVTVGHTGESFVKSVQPAVNAARAMSFSNGRFGINGGSFGGYAGLYLISHLDIFAAAVLRAPPSEFFSTWADGRDRDIWTIETGQARTGGSPWQNPLVYIDNSPFFSADRVHTPLLILHGEKDFTVPTQQGEMMFYALRYLKAPVELALYREGDHSIVRGSREDYLDYYQRTLDWWGKYLRAPRGTP